MMRDPLEQLYAFLFDGDGNISLAVSIVSIVVVLVHYFQTRRLSRYTDRLHKLERTDVEQFLEKIRGTRLK